MTALASAPNSKYGLIVVSAPSGAGKSTLCTRLLRDLSSQVAISISSTSRAPRGQEQNGREYFFVSKDEFLKQIDQNQFAEWALVHGNYYGTTKKTLEQYWSAKRHVLLDIDVQGAANLRAQYSERAFLVFIAPPSLEELEKRLRGRGTESESAIAQRMSNARQELLHQNEFDAVIVNDDLERAYAQLKTICEDFIHRLEEGKWRKHP